MRHLEECAQTTRRERKTCMSNMNLLPQHRRCGYSYLFLLIRIRVSTSAVLCEYSHLEYVYAVTRLMKKTLQMFKWAGQLNLNFNSFDCIRSPLVFVQYYEYVPVGERAQRAHLPVSKVRREETTMSSVHTICTRFLFVQLHYEVHRLDFCPLNHTTKYTETVTNTASYTVEYTKDHMHNIHIRQDARLCVCV